MHHFFEAITNTKGDALTGYYVKVVNGAGVVQTLYADTSLTPIISVSGIADTALVDSDGNVNFYVGVGTWNLDIYATDGTTKIKTVENVAMNVDADTAAAGLAAETAAAASAAASAASASASNASAASSAASALAAAAVFSGTAGVVALPRFTPEAYMAPGRVEGTTDDGPALAAMSAALNAIGRGAVDFYTGRTYWVGSQTANASTPNGTYRYAPNTVYPLEINACTGPVVINPNGARIKCLAGKKFGSFEADGTASLTIQTLGTKAATPYFAMVYIHACTGPVTFTSPLELDGNISAVSLGGLFGDAGRQLPMTGVMLTDNTGPLDINVYSHHHGLDGGVGDGPGLLTVKESVVIRGRYRNNGRNNFSLVGGNGWHFASGIELVGAGKNIGAMTYSPPGAGLDLEAEGGKYVVNTTMNDPYIDDNTGVGIVSDTNAFVNGFHCKGGKIIGTTDWSLWPYNPRFVFEHALILGAMVDAYPNADPALACRFKRCRFSTDTTLSPSGVLYGGGTARFFDNGGGSTNLQFTECEFEETDVTATNVLSAANAWFDNCTFRAHAAHKFSVVGQFTGPRTTFVGSMGSMPRADLVGALSLDYAGPSFDNFLYDGTRYAGDSDRVTGKKVYYGTATYNPPSLALAAKDTIQTMTLTGVALGDSVEDVSFSLNLAGARIVAWVSATDTVSYYAINENGTNPLDLASGTARVKVRQA